MAPLTQRGVVPSAQKIKTEEWPGVTCLERSLRKGMRRSRNQWRTAPLHWMRARHSVNEGFGKEFHGKGNSVKRSGPFSEPLDSENRKTFCAPPPCPSFPWSLRRYQGKSQKRQGFLSPCDPVKPWKISRKHPKRPRNVIARKVPTKQKHQGNGYPADVWADIRADVPALKLSPIARSTGKQSFFCADILDPKPRTSMTQGGLRKTLPSDTKLLLTKNYSEIIIFEKLRISRVISGKSLSSGRFQEWKFPQRLRKIILRELFSQ